jgi:anthranilate synthase component 1
MYFLNLDGHSVIGSSPEILAKLAGRRVSVRPLAGTRPRGQTAERDQALEAELRADAKEAAEHLMLVDLARNDLGRICDFGSIAVSDMMQIERYSRVMHLVSHVEGNLRAGRDAFDVVRTTFPAGTVSGAPKIRAMEIIDELEPTRRGLYAGAIGYFDVSGDMDLCIAIRMILVKGERGYIQAGAGIVADSDPSCEYQETLNKANAMMRAVELAEKRANHRDTETQRNQR